jgi:pimeloyl-ACP methyl ester carboxylesterase
MPFTHKIERRFIAVDGRRVHYRKMGKGPPAVMLHASPANSTMVLAEMAAAAPYFTCYAFDTPGFGQSDPLPGDDLTVADLAAATAAAMRTLGLPACPVFGTHTGAAVALELGVGWPEQVSGLVLDGLPAFNDAEIASLFDGYFASFPADPLGAHFTTIWVRFRDQFTWFPWTSRHVSRLNAIDRPTPEDIQFWVMMYNDCRKTYMAAYRAACFYGSAALRAVEALTLPAVFMATEEDMLFGHLDRLPPLRPLQRILRLGQDVKAKHAAIVECLRAMPSGPVKTIAMPTTPVGTDPAVQFIDTPDGQIFARCYGDRTNPAVMLLHDAPGTGLSLEAVARSMAADAYVILPDLPGTGDSDAPAQDRPILEAAASALGAVADALGLESYIIAGVGCGCAVAAQAVELDDPRVTAILLDQMPEPDERIAQAIAPDIPLSPEGSHWLQVWLMLRDGQIYRPWFDGSIASQRRTQGNFDADWLHDQTFALMKSRETYHRVARAAYRCDSASALSRASAPVSHAADGGLAALILETLQWKEKTS